jgi:hypothetical protein
MTPRLTILTLGGEFRFTRRQSDRFKALAAQGPEWKKEPFASLLKRNIKEWPRAADWKG